MINLLRAFAALGPRTYRYPDDLVRGSLPEAHGMAKDGLLHRNPATGYFAITDSGLELARAMGIEQ